MAERRMFAKMIVTSDEFLDMPLSARCLYFTFGMFADDDGFVNNPKSIIRQIGASQDDMSILLLKKYIIPFETGVIVIRHWRINNYLRNDRYQPTKYTKEKELLTVDGNGIYQEYNTGIPNNGIPSIGKDSIGKVSKEKEESDVSNDTARHRFVKPTVDEIRAYCEERGNGIDAEQFWDFYESKGWKVGTGAMKDWKACVRTWEKRERRTQNTNGSESWLDTLDKIEVKV